MTELSSSKLEQRVLMFEGPVNLEMYDLPFAPSQSSTKITEKVLKIET